MIALTCLIIGAVVGWLYLDLQFVLEKQRREDRIFRAIQDRAEREAKL